MTANLTLDVIGTDTGTFTVYQDSDNYTTPVASGLTAAQLSTPYSLTTLDNATTTLRVVSSGSCNNYKDISVNFGDTTPAVTKTSSTLVSTSTSTSNDISYATDGVSRAIVIYKYAANTIQVSLGTSANSFNFVTTSEFVDSISSFSQVRVIYDGSNFYMTVHDTSSSPFFLKIYRIDGFLGTDSVPTVSFTLVSNLGSNLMPTTGGAIYDYKYINNKYYIVTSIGVFRSSDNLTYVNVLPFTNQFSAVGKSMDNYGNTIFFCNIDSLYKSTDNGLNWTLVFSNGSVTDNGWIDGVFVENLDNIILYKSKRSTTTSNVTQYYHSSDGGSTFVFISLGNSSSGNLDGQLQMIKHNSVYIYFHLATATAGYISYISGSLPYSFSARTNVSGSSYDAGYTENHMFIVRDKLICFYQDVTSDQKQVCTFTIANT
jgi:hypothetical protein